MNCIEVVTILEYGNYCQTAYIGKNLAGIGKVPDQYLH